MHTKLTYCFFLLCLGLNHLIIICSEENEQQSNVTLTLKSYLVDNFILLPNNEIKSSIFQKLQQQNQNEENLLFKASSVDNDA